MYREIAAPADLAPFVASYWEHTAPGATQTIVPDTCFDVLFYLHGANVVSGYLVGPQMKPIHTDPLGPEIAVFGIRFQRGTGFALLGLPLILLQDVREELSSFTETLPLWLRSSLLDAVGSSHSFSERIRQSNVLLRKYVRRRDAFQAIHPCVVAAMHLLERGGTLATLERKVGYSQRQLERLFSQHAGYTPKQFARVARFRSALAAVEEGKKSAVIAAELGYVDQSHFVHEFREFSDTTPGAWKRRPDHVGFLQDESSIGHVPNSPCTSKNRRQS